MTGNVDFIETGSGPTVVLVHSSVAGARQWRTLMELLQDRFHIVAVNLIGYGETPPWRERREQTLEDQAAVVRAVLPDGEDAVRLVGHSFGGAVAMKVAGQLGSRIERLALLEPNPFTLLEQNGCDEAFAECLQLRDWTKDHGGSGDWMTAASRFADFWAGAGSWDAMPPERRAKFAEAFRPTFHEWDAVMRETTTLEDWETALPAQTLVVWARDTARPIRDIVGLMRRQCRHWRFKEIEEGGHMAPLTRPDLVNPIVADFLGPGQAKIG